MEQKRDSWKSRMTFIFAAIGSAVGLGNAWRFPGLAAKYGGGTFLLIYVVAMLIMGWPLLMMEIAMGRHMQQGAVNTMRAVNKKSEFIGWASVINAFFIASYYAVILAWILVMIIKSFRMGGLSPEVVGGIFTGEGALNVVSLPDSITQIFSSFSLDIPGGIFLGLIISWIVIYLCIRKGAHSAGKVVPYTVIIPVVLLLVLAINGMVTDFTKASGSGLAKFFMPDFSALGNSGLWIDAFGQVFYSLSIMMAIMIAYGSFVHKKSDIVKDSLIIAISDMLISILAGIVLFTTLSGTGQLESYIQGVSSGDIGSIGTAFIIYPQAMVLLTKIPAVNSLFAFLFYCTLLTLAIDSAFSIIEGISTSISDKFRLNRKKTTLAVCCASGVVSILFATRGGLNWLDIVDSWCNNFNLILVGILECVAVGWFFKTSNVREELNLSSTGIKIGKAYDWIIKIVAPVVLSALFIWQFVTLMISYATGKGYGGYPLYAQILGGWMVTALTFGGAFLMQYLSQHNKKIVELDADLKTWEEMDMIEKESFHEQDVEEEHHHAHTTPLETVEK